MTIIRGIPDDYRPSLDDLRCTIAVNAWPWERISWSALILDLGEGLVLANDCGGE